MEQLDFYKKLSSYIEFKQGIPYRTQTTSSRAIKGTRAGSIDSYGYRTIRVSIMGKSKLLLAHRLHWYQAYGYLPTEIDHIDGNKDNNNLDNLREVTHSQNIYNIKKRPGTSSKYRGVHFHKQSGKWRAKIKHEGKVKSLGLFNSEVEAGEAYNTAVYYYNLEEFIPLNGI